jgi:hypothetical protein
MTLFVSHIFAIRVVNSFLNARVIEAARYTNRCKKSKYISIVDRWVSYAIRIFKKETIDVINDSLSFVVLTRCAPCEE